MSPGSVPFVIAAWSLERLQPGVGDGVRSSEELAAGSYVRAWLPSRIHGLLIANDKRHGDRLAFAIEKRGPSGACTAAVRLSSRNLSTLSASLIEPSGLTTWKVPNFIEVMPNSYSGATASLIASQVYHREPELSRKFA